jgi:L-ascorbate metabolism protein UlaG (beta-lactamase superfamily)
VPDPLTIRFLGHAAFTLSDGATTLLIDPFLSKNPKAAIDPDEVSPDAILLTHGHPDHVGDTVDIATRTGAPVVATVGLGNELREDLPEGHDVQTANLGGTLTFAWGSVRFVTAAHHSRTPRGTPDTPSGLVIAFAGRRIYHLGDTALIADLALAGRGERFDVAMVCIGGHHTMDRVDAVEAVRLVQTDTVIPCHYGTQPVIETDVGAFAADVAAAGLAEVATLEPGAELVVA